MHRCINIAFKRGMTSTRWRPFINSHALCFKSPTPAISFHYYSRMELVLHHTRLNLCSHMEKSVWQLIGGKSSMQKLYALIQLYKILYIWKCARSYTTLKQNGFLSVWLVLTTTCYNIVYPCSDAHSLVSLLKESKPLVLLELWWSMAGIVFSNQCKATLVKPKSHCYLSLGILPVKKTWKYLRRKLIVEAFYSYFVSWAPTVFWSYSTKVIYPTFTEHWGILTFLLFFIIIRIALGTALGTFWIFNNETNRKERKKKKENH